MTLAAAVVCQRTVHIFGGWKTNGEFIYEGTDLIHRNR